MLDPHQAAALQQMLQGAGMAPAPPSPVEQLVAKMSPEDRTMYNQAMEAITYEENHVKQKMDVPPDVAAVANYYRTKVLPKILERYAPPPAPLQPATPPLPTLGGR